MHGGAGAVMGPESGDLEMHSGDLSVFLSSAAALGNGVGDRQSSLELHGGETEGRGPDSLSTYGSRAGEGGTASSDLDLASGGLKTRSLSSEVAGDGVSGLRSPVTAVGGSVDEDAQMDLSELQPDSGVAPAGVSSASVLGAMPGSVGQSFCGSFAMLPPSSFQLSAAVRKGTENDMGDGQPRIRASQASTQGAWLNATSSSSMPALGLPSKLNSDNPWFNKAMPWTKPRVVPLPMVENLCQFPSVDAVAILDEEATDITLKKLDHAIIGRMFGRRIPLHVLSSELRRRWGGLGKFRLVTLSSDCFLCIFDNTEACNAILLDGPWVILGQVLGVDRWTPSFSPSSLEGFRTPVWIRMPSLPLYCWSSVNISKIVALVGEPMWMDSATDQLEKGSFARACVRLDLSKPLRSGVWVQGRYGKFFQPLEYEGLSVFCFHCSQVGHKASSCKVNGSKSGRCDGSPYMAPGVNHVPLKVPDKLVGDSHKLDVSSQRAEVGPQVQCMDDLMKAELQPVERGIGPWMMVTRKKKSTMAAPPKNNWKSSFVKSYNGFHSGPADGVGSSKLGTWTKHHGSPSKYIKNKGSPSTIRGTEAIHCMDSIKPTEMGDIEHWNGDSIDSAGRQFETQCVEVLHETKLKLAEPQLEEGQSDFTNMEEGHADLTIISDMPMDSKMEKMEDATHVGDMHVNDQQHFELGIEGIQPIFPSFSAQPWRDVGSASASVMAKVRSRGGKTRGAKKEKMACELGPVAPGSRKRRKAQSLNDGGDASPSSPP